MPSEGFAPETTLQHGWSLVQLGEPPSPVADPESCVPPDPLSEPLDEPLSVPRQADAHMMHEVARHVEQFAAVHAAACDWQLLCTQVPHAALIWLATDVLQPPLDASVPPELLPEPLPESFALPLLLPLLVPLLLPLPNPLPALLSPDDEHPAKSASAPTRPAPNMTTFCITAS